MKLQAVYLLPGVSFTPGVGGYSSTQSFWDVDKHPQLKCEEQKNGDIWLTNPRGTRIEISALAISNKVRVPEKAAKP